MPFSVSLGYLGSLQEVIELCCNCHGPLTLQAALTPSVYRKGGPSWLDVEESQLLFDSSLFFFFFSSLLSGFCMDFVVFLGIEFILV